jgi:ornithine carbamoyltransferase
VDEPLEVARRFAAESGGSLSVTHSMNEAFDGADIVYPKSWAPTHVMARRTELMHAGDRAGLAALETECLVENARHRAWECSEELMATTRDGRGLYLHCLPADISGVSCPSGEVTAAVFERFRPQLYRQAGWKPYVIAAMILAGRREDPAATLRQLAARCGPRGGS